MMVIASLYSHSVNEKCFRQSGEKESDGEERKAMPYGLAAAFVSGFSAFDIRRIIWTKEIPRGSSNLPLARVSEPVYFFWVPIL
jgi:hypothetical protein